MPRPIFCLFRTVNRCPFTRWVLLNWLPRPFGGSHNGLFVDDYRRNDPISA